MEILINPTEVKIGPMGSKGLSAFPFFRIVSANEGLYIGDMAIEIVRTGMVITVRPADGYMQQTVGEFGQYECSKMTTRQMIDRVLVLYNMCLSKEYNEPPTIS